MFCNEWWWKATVSFVMSVRPSRLSSVRMEQLVSHWIDFHEIWYLSIFRKCIEKIQVSLKYDQNNEFFTWNPVTFMIVSRSVLLALRNVSDKFVEKIKTCVLHSVTFPRKSSRMWGDLEKYCRTGQAIDDNIAHAHYMLDA